MKRNFSFLKIAITLIASVLLPILISFTPGDKEPENFVSHQVDLSSSDLRMYWKNEKGIIYGNFSNLKADLEKSGKKLTFAMNGGMYNKDHSPQGLYIEKGTELAPVDNSNKDYGNFYMKPNGVFYITGDRRGVICNTTDFNNASNIKYATQSGPMLLIDGAIHPKFNKASESLNIRNGVGILPDGKVIFTMSKEPINFYNFALYFKELGCKNALYLDGFVSRTYLPSGNWQQMDGNFAVIIAEISSNKDL